MATIKLELTPELEQQLKIEAGKEGLDPDRYILSALQERFRRQSPQIAHLSEVEANLLQQIGIGLPPRDWERYHLLIEKRRAENLTADEQTELVQLTDRIEQANAKRIEAAIELAKLRGTSLSLLMHELGIETPKYV